MLLFFRRRWACRSQYTATIVIQHHPWALVTPFSIALAPRGFKLRLTSRRSKYNLRLLGFFILLDKECRIPDPRRCCESYLESQFSTLCAFPPISFLPTAMQSSKISSLLPVPTPKGRVRATSSPTVPSDPPPQDSNINTHSSFLKGARARSAHLSSVTVLQELALCMTFHGHPLLALDLRCGENPFVFLTLLP